MSINIRSLNANFQEFQQLALEYKPNIICIQETFRPFAANMVMNGYHPLVLKVRPENHAGGVAIFLESSISFTPIKEINEMNLKVLEVVAVDAQIKNEKVVILSLYRPPASKLNETYNDLESLLEKIGERRIVIAGDVNLDYSKDNQIKNRYARLLLNFNLIQHVRAKTKIMAYSAS